MEKLYIEMYMGRDDGAEINLKLYIQPKNLNRFLNSFLKKLVSVGVPEKEAKDLLTGRKTGKKASLVKKTLRYYASYMFLKKPSIFKILKPGAISFSGTVKRRIDPKEIASEVNKAVRTSSSPDEIVKNLKKNYKDVQFEDVERDLVLGLHNIADMFGWYAPPGLIKV